MNKVNNKEAKITVRLTPYQSFELSNIAKKTGVSKSAVVRCVIQKTIEDYYERFN